MCGSRSGFIVLIRIRIHKASENGSNTDPDPQHCTHLDVLRAWQRGRLRPVLVEGRHDVAVLPALLAGQEDQAVVVVGHRRVLNLEDGIPVEVSTTVQYDNNNNNNNIGR